MHEKGGVKFHLSNANFQDLHGHRKLLWIYYCGCVVSHHSILLEALCGGGWLVVGRHRRRQLVFERSRL